MSRCASELYTRKELRTQKVPVALQHKTWILKKIDGPKEPARSIGRDLQNNGDCVFSYQFADKGVLLVNFQEHAFSGTYVIDGEKFKHIHGGAKDQIVWDINPECKVTPTEIAYILEGQFEFKIEGKFLTLKNDQGEILEFISKD
jgi:hypothetical protein